MLSLDLGSQMFFSVHSGLGGIANFIDDLLGTVEHLARLTPPQIFAELMPGITALSNIHPLFVHFPIVLLTLFFIVDVLGTVLARPAIREGASWLLYLGTVCASAAVAAGLQAASTVAHGDDVHGIMEHHEHLAITVLLLTLLLSVWRIWSHGSLRSGANVVHLTLAGLMTVLLAFTADLGGLMVYGYGVAVKPVADCNQEAVALHQHSETRDQPAALQPGAETFGNGVSVEVQPAQPSVHTHADGSHHIHKHHHH